MVGLIQICLALLLSLYTRIRHRTNNRNTLEYIPIHSSILPKIRLNRLKEDILPNIVGKLKVVQGIDCVADPSVRSCYV